MKITFNRKIVDGPYGGGNQILRLLVRYFKNKGFDVSFSLDEDTEIVIAMDVRDEVCTFPRLQAHRIQKES